LLDADSSHSMGDTFEDERNSIWERTTRLYPALDSPGTEVLATFAGLRPGREGGARIEKVERAGGCMVVHNYGAGGTGFQAGLGMATEAVGLALPHLSHIIQRSSHQHVQERANL
jgi:D-amino-acid oxidase